jgi:hypothetical protein
VIAHNISPIFKPTIFPKACSINNCTNQSKEYRTS